MVQGVIFPASAGGNATCFACRDPPAYSWRPRASGSRLRRARGLPTAGRSLARSNRLRVLANQAPATACHNSDRCRRYNLCMTWAYRQFGFATRAVFSPLLSRKRLCASRQPNDPAACMQFRAGPNRAGMLDFSDDFAGGRPRSVLVSTATGAVKKSLVSFTASTHSWGKWHEHPLPRQHRAK